jgi:hypothetical protein
VTLFDSGFSIQDEPTGLVNLSGEGYYIPFSRIQYFNHNPDGTIKFDEFTFRSAAHAELIDRTFQKYRAKGD